MHVGKQDWSKPPSPNSAALMPCLLSWNLLPWHAAAMHCGLGSPVCDPAVTYHSDSFQPKNSHYQSQHIFWPKKFCLVSVRLWPGSVYFCMTAHLLLYWHLRVTSNLHERVPDMLKPFMGPYSCPEHHPWGALLLASLDLQHGPLSPPHPSALPSKNQSLKNKTWNVHEHTAIQNTAFLQMTF